MPENTSSASDGAMDNRVAFSRREWARAVGLGLTSIDTAIRTGELATVRLGRRRLILKEDGERWLRALRTTTA